MPGAVLDGRDIGTIVCPDAKIKIFLTASLEARAKRRYIELNKLDQKIRLETILDQIRERDERDQTRSSSPMVAASDAKIIDTSDLSIKEAVQKVFRYIQKKINS
jgi:cytidylate kinase